VKLYGIASNLSHDVDDWYSTREEAETVLAQVLADEPAFAGVVYVAEVELLASDN
jgi:hypothetical protein